MSLWVSLRAKVAAAHRGLLDPSHADTTPSPPPDRAPALGQMLGVMALAALVIVVAHYQGSADALSKRWPAMWEQPEPQRWVWPQLYTAAVSAALHLGVAWGLVAVGWARLRGPAQVRTAGAGERLEPWLVGWRLGAVCGALFGLLVAASPVMVGARHWAAPPAPLAGWALWATAGGQVVRAVGLEVFYRGLLVVGTRPALGVSGAVGLSLIPWMMAHYHLSLPQALAGWLTGAGLGWLAARRGSIWLGVGLHVGAVAARAAWQALG